MRDVNAYANGDRADVKIFINADIEQNCFELDVRLVQTIWEQTKDLVMDDDVIAIKGNRPVDRDNWCGVHFCVLWIISTYQVDSGQASEFY